VELKNASPIRRPNILLLGFHEMRDKEESVIQMFFFLSRGSMGGTLAIEGLCPGI